jgi:hypothetical protein
MTDNGAGSLELAISEVKLDKTIMEKSISVVIEIDNRQVTTVPIVKMAKKVKADIASSDEIMELKICTGATGKEIDHIGKTSILLLLVFQLQTKRTRFYNETWSLWYTQDQKIFISCSCKFYTKRVVFLCKI